jgi:ABC-type multidrug transport system ATPase subunit
MTESLVLEDVGVKGATGWLARNLTFGLLPGQVLAVVSPQSADALRGLLAIVGALPCDEGKVLNAAGRPGVGWLPTGPGLTPGVTVIDHMRDAASVRKPSIGEAQLHERLRQVGLDGEARRTVETLDHSEKVRLGLALALLHQVGVVAVPELDSGLPADLATQLWNLIFSLAGTGMVVVVGCATPDPRCHLALELWRYGA